MERQVIGCIGMVQRLTMGDSNDIRNYFFTKRVVSHWNRLPREVINTQSLSVFKQHLNNALNNMF